MRALTLILGIILAAYGGAGVLAETIWQNNEPCLSGWLPITLLGESTYHCRASRKWVLRHAPRDRGQS